MLDQHTNKHQQVRAQICEYILIMLMDQVNVDFNIYRKRHQLAQVDSLDKFEKDIASMILTLIQDPHAEVRRRARLVFVVFRELHPEGAAELLHKMQDRDVAALKETYAVFGLNFETGAKLYESFLPMKSPMPVGAPRHQTQYSFRRSPKAGLETSKSNQDLQVVNY